MGGILTITLPIFALIGLGYGSVRLGMFKVQDMRVLGTYVLNIALPALLFNAVAKRSFSEVLNVEYLSVFLLGGMATIFVVYALTGVQGVGPARRAIAAMGSACPNSGYVGFPMILLIFPDLAGVVLAMNMLVENFILIPTCLILLEFSRPRAGRSILRLLGEILFSVVRRPLVIGLFLGLAVSITGLALPAAAVRLLDVLAASASALALFVIGGSLVGLPTKGNRALAAEIVVGKLLLHPALTFGAMALLAAIGVGVPMGDLAVALILSTAMPMFGIYTLLAQEYGYEGLASLALLGATTGAFVTLTIMIGWLV